MPKLAPVSLVMAAFLVGACASGPDFSEVGASIEPPAEGKARLYFYRSQVFGAAIQPSIVLNGEAVGSCQPKGVFYKDVDPGKYDAWVKTEVTRNLSMVVEAGEERYINCYVTFGILVGRAHLKLVDPAEGRSAIQSLNYTGS